MGKTKEAEKIFRKLLNRVNPTKLIPEIVQLERKPLRLSVFGHTILLSEDKPIYAIGTGKASASMAYALESVLHSHLKAGLVISSPDPMHKTAKVRTIFGSHPYPDINTYNSSTELLRFIEQIPEGALVINLVSGGTSSLFCQPAGDISIYQLSEVYKLLVNSGASIDEINTVRKSISAVKGGQLLSNLSHTHLIDLIISDVPDDNPKDIGSGPTIPQQISGKHSQQILEKFALWNQVPKAVQKHITNLVETESKTGPVLTDDIQNHQSFIISSASIVAKKAEELWKKKGYITKLDENTWTGPIEEFEKKIIKQTQSEVSHHNLPVVYIFYGECTVNITGSGKGGRNQELALRIAKRIKDSDKLITFLSAGTDGIDGPTDTAGAVVDQNTWQEAEKNGLDPDTCLNNNDSYNFFKKAGGHIKTGPTGNNVMDIQFLIMEPAG